MIDHGSGVGGAIVLRVREGEKSFHADAKGLGHGSSFRFERVVFNERSVGESVDFGLCIVNGTTAIVDCYEKHKVSDRERVQVIGSVRFNALKKFKIGAIPAKDGRVRVRETTGRTFLSHKEIDFTLVCEEVNASSACGGQILRMDEIIDQVRVVAIDVGRHTEMLSIIIAGECQKVVISRHLNEVYVFDPNSAEVVTRPCGEDELPSVPHKQLRVDTVLLEKRASEIVGHDKVEMALHRKRLERRNRIVGHRLYVNELFRV